MANETGKRYFCANCNSEFIITKGGDGEMACCGVPMQKK